MKARSMRRTVTATDAAKSFGSLIDRVRESGAVYQVESRGQVVAEISPPRRRFTLADFQDVMRRAGRAPAELLDAIEEARAEARRAPAAPSVKLSGRGGRKTR